MSLVIYGFGGEHAYTLCFMELISKTRHTTACGWRVPVLITVKYYSVKRQAVSTVMCFIDINSFTVGAC